MNIFKKWFGNGKEEKSFDFVSVDTNIYRLNSDEEIKRFLSLNQFLNELSDAVQTDTEETKFTAKLFAEIPSIGTNFVIIVVRYRFATEEGQWDLFMIKNPVSEGTNLYKIVSYLEKSVDRNIYDIVNLLKHVIQSQINKDIKVTIEISSQLIYFSFAQQEAVSNNEVSNFVLLSSSENTVESKEVQKPELVLVMGSVCAGKTTLRKEKYANGYVHIDAGEIFILLSQGEYYDFPSHLEDEMNHVGLEIMRKCLKERRNIVIEIIGSDENLVKEFCNIGKRINYSVNGVLVTCKSDEERMQRNMNRGNNISAYYCEPYHINWFGQASMEV